jgi:DNA polymerase delta subunit 2
VAHRFLGGSGQTLDDLHRYTATDDRLALMEQTLHWRHLAPTAPDTLGACGTERPPLRALYVDTVRAGAGAYPMYERDPFIITGDCPHVYFVGNQPAYGTRLVQGA